MATIRKYHHLRPEEIEKLRSEFPVAYIPWGAIEWHSYHAPIGLDGLIADGLCDALADAIGGLVFPPMYLATDTIKVFKGFPHSVEHPESTVKLVCQELLHQLVAEGFEAVVVITGHAGGKHTDALAEVIDSFNREGQHTRAVLYTPFAPIQDAFPANHAADGETSLLLALQPELVRLDALPADRQTTLDDDGVWGDDPRDATAAKGRDIVQAFVDAVSSEVRSLITR